MNISNLEVGKESDPFDLFVFAINAEQTKTKYISRLKKFMEISGIDSEQKLTVNEKCKALTIKARSENGWLVSVIVRFLQFQKDRVSRKEISAGTLHNYVKAIKLFCEMNDLPVQWKKLKRGLPKAKNYADDRVPTIGEIHWMDFRRDAGEEITKDSWVMRDLWNTRLACRRGGNIGVASRPLRLKSSGIKRLMEDALWSQGIRSKLEPGKKRHEFQVDHGYRKWFKTQCELAGMRSINIEKLMGHSIGISDSYYRITENDMLDDYLNAVSFLTINESTILREQVTHLSQRTKEIVHKELEEKNVEIRQIREHDQMHMDAIAALSDQVMKLMSDMELLKKNRINTRV